MTKFGKSDASCLSSLTNHGEFQALPSPTVQALSDLILEFDRLEFAPGEEAQLECGEGALTLHPCTERYRRPRLFVMTLRYSRRSFRRVVWTSSQEAWARLHEQAWRYFGGSSQYVVLDNLKEGVIKPDLYEPQLNPVYAAVLAHYGVVADRWTSPVSRDTGASLRKPARPVLTRPAAASVRQRGRPPRAPRPNAPLPESALVSRTAPASSGSP